jgi:hypothetical protein
MFCPSLAVGVPIKETSPYFQDDGPQSQCSIVCISVILKLFLQRLNSHDGSILNLSLVGYRLMKKTFIVQNSIIRHTKNGHKFSAIF